MRIDVQEGDWKTLQHDCERVRLMVFVAEQHVPKDEELDEEDEKARHFVARDERHMVLGCARLLSTGQIGRLAVLRPFRKRGIGKALMTKVLESAARRGMKSVWLNAQTHAISFYGRLGFSAVGETFQECGIEHIRMEKQL